MAILAADSILFSLIAMYFDFKLYLIRVQLKQESLVISFIFTMICRIFLESASSEEIVMLTFDYVKRRALISNKL